MFCPKCGVKTTDEAIFCASCGSKINGGINSGLNAPVKNLSLVPAKCTNCGGALNVNPQQDAAVCPFCNQPFIIDKAINNFNVVVTGKTVIEHADINIQGAPSILNLLARAEAFERQGNILKAIEYYNKVLDLDISDTKASTALYRLFNNPFYSEHASYGFSSGILVLRKDNLAYVSNSGKETRYELRNIIKVTSLFSNLNIYTYAGKSFYDNSNPNGVSHTVKITSGRKDAAKNWINIVDNAKKFIYPSQI